MNWQAPIETVRELEALYLNARGCSRRAPTCSPQEDHEVAFFGWAPTGTLYCNYQRQSLQGQVCSIVADPSFSALSERAQAMRQRRRQSPRPPPPPEGSAAG